MSFTPSNKKATGQEIVTTSCCECVFAEFVGDTQTDCSMGRLEKFRKNGTVVLEAQNDEKEFYVVERFCSAYRDSEWDDILFYYSTDLSESREERVRREVQIRCGIFLGYDETCDISGLSDSLASILRQGIKPLYVTVANCSSTNNMDILHTLNFHLEGTGIIYTCSNVSIDELSTKDQTHVPEIWRAIDCAFDVTGKNGYYAAAKSGYEFAKDYLSSINHYINEEMKQVILVRSDDNESYFMQCSLHKLLYGSNGKFVVEKVTELSEEQDLYHMTANLSTVKEIYESSTSNNSSS